MALQDRRRARRLSINNREMLFAATDGNLEKIKKLINDGADVNFADRDGNTPLHWAVESGSKKVVDFLMTKGASAKHKNLKNETPIDIGKRIERQDIVKILDPPLPSKALILPRLEQSPKKVFEFDLTQDFMSKIQNNIVNVINDKQPEKRLNNPVHGHIYQLKVLMLFLYRGIAHKYSFRLGSEIRDAKKFDDLVFEYTKGGQKIYRLLQAKHKLDESKKITAEDLLYANNGDYNLMKYFFSYLESKKAELFKDGLIEDVTICTNIDFDMKSLESNRIRIEEITDKDEISDVESDRKKPIRYKFNENIIKTLKSTLQNYRLPRLSTMIEYSDYDMKDFLNHLVFAVNQPNEEELGCIVKNEISKEFDFFTEDVYNKFFITMLDWLQGKGKGLFLSSDEGKQFFEEMNKGIQFWFDVKPPMDSFTGRSKKLNELHKLLTPKGKSGSSQLVCITGLGGVGKSELAKKYITQYSQEYDNKVVWLNAESYESLAKSFRRLACDQLRISLKNADNEEKKLISVVEDVYRFFSQRKCLFVFDNAEKYKSHTEYDNGIDTFLPADRKRLHVLITSRNQDWPSGTRVLPLSVFEEVEAIEFIKKSLKVRNAEKEKDIVDIARELQCFPLALQQAVAYIKKQKEKLKNIGLVFEIHEYLEKYRSKTKNFLTSEFSEDNNYAKTIYSTWNVTLDAIRQKDNGAFACQILEMLSFFAPSDIPVKTIINLVNGDVEIASDAIQLLKQYSMINVENKILYLHRLVQQVTRLHVQDEKREEEVLFKALQSFTRENLNLENVEHAISLWEYSNKYENLMIEFFQLPSLISAELLNDARYEETRIFGLKVSELLRKLPSRDMRILIGILAVKNNIGQALLEQGKYDTALHEFLKVLTIQKHYFGPDHPGNVGVKNNIALALTNQGKYEKALEIYYEILEFEERTNGKTHPDALLAKFDIGTVLTILGKYKESLKMLEEVLSIQEAILGKDDNKTLKTKASIAAVLFRLNRYEEALKLYKETLIINERTLPRHHPDILTAKSNIAGILLRQGEYKNALQLYTDVYEITIEAYGESHPDVLNCRRHMAEILRGQGEVNESLKIYEEVFQQQMRLLGGEHPDTINTQYSIAQVLHIDHKNYSAALHAYETLLKKCEMVFGDKNFLTIEVRISIAEVLMHQQKYNQAMKYYQQAYVIQKANLGDNHPDTLCALNSTGMALYHQNQLDEALEIFRECYNKLRSSSPDHPNVLAFKQNIAQALYNQQKYDEALPIFREILEVNEATLGKNHPSFTAIKNTIAVILQSKMNHGLASKMSNQFSKVNEVILDVHLPYTAETNDSIKSLSSVAKESLTAAKKNSLEKLEILLDKNVDVNTADDDGITLLHYAVNNGNLNMVKALIKKKADVTKISKKGNTPLHVATLKGHKEILELLLKHANPEKLYDFVNTKTTTSGATALHVAAKNGSLELVRLLLKHNSIHNILNHKCETPLYVSTNESVDRLLYYIEMFFEDVKKGEANILDRLNKMDPDELTAILNARDLRGNTLLQASIINKHKNISSGLLKFMKK